MPGVIQAASPSDCRSVIQLGLLLLILTPIARGAFPGWLWTGARPNLHGTHFHRANDPGLQPGSAALMHSPGSEQLAILHVKYVKKSRFGFFQLTKAMVQRVAAILV